jgi:hypothetical protein
MNSDLPNATTDYDIVFVTDLRFPGGTSSSLVEELVAATSGGYRVAILQLASTRLTSEKVHARLRTMVEDGPVRLLLPGEAASTRAVIVKHPTVFFNPLGGPLPIATEQVLVAVGQVPKDDAGTYYDPVAVAANIEEAFGCTPVWSPVSPLVRASLDGVQMYDEDWIEIIDVAAWRTPSTTLSTDDPTEPSDDSSPARTLVIGRHSRPHPMKWPGDADELRAVYPTDGSVTVRVLGGADFAGKVLGEIPPAWEVFPFGAVEPVDFLAGLDAFVYFHHRDLDEAFGRTVLEALAADVPAIVPHHFEATFGAACLYAEPHDAIQVARTHLADPAARTAHSAVVSELLDARYSHIAYRGRLERLIGPPVLAPLLDPAHAPSL